MNRMILALIIVMLLLFNIRSFGKWYESDTEQSIVPSKLNDKLTKLQKNTGEHGLQQVLMLINNERCIIGALLYDANSNHICKLTKMRKKLLKYATPSACYIYRRVLDEVMPREFESCLYQHHIKAGKPLHTALSRKMKRQFLTRMDELLANYYVMIKRLAMKNLPIHK